MPLHWLHFSSLFYSLSFLILGYSWCKGCLAVQQVIHFLWQLTHGGPRKQVLQWCRHSEAFGEVGQKSRTQRAPNAWHGSNTDIIWPIWLKVLFILFFHFKLHWDQTTSPVVVYVERSCCTSRTGQCRVSEVPSLHKWFKLDSLNQMHWMAELSSDNGPRLGSGICNKYGKYSVFLPQYHPPEVSTYKACLGFASVLSRLSQTLKNKE